MTTIKFGTDGWRAGIGEDYTFANVRRITQGVADYLHAHGEAGRGMIVGFDTRFRSDDFASAVCEVLAGNGIKAHLCQAPAPTPVSSYAILDRQTAGGINITASHNPYTDNGYKLRSEYGGAADIRVLQEVEERIGAVREAKGMPLPEAREAGLVEVFDPAPAYVAHISNLVELPRLREAGLHIALDPMWGVGVGWFERLIGGGRTRLTTIHDGRNPLFPDMERPEPIAENLQTLMRTVRKVGADVGIANDGDADRVGVIDEQGRFINQLEVYALLALYLLEVRGWRGPLVKTVTTTMMATKLGQRYGLPVYETGVGFKYVAPKMLEVDAIMGGEESGGFAFRGHLPERDGILAGLFILDLMVQKRMSPSQLLGYLFDLVGPHYYDRIDTRLEPAEKPAIMERVRAAQPSEIAGLKVTEIDTSDGFRYVLGSEGWLLIRFSGTEPVLRVYTETTQEAKVREILAAGLQLAGVDAEGARL
ncbi:MAG: phosphoglucomutase/phosphomannomutase family protein [Anaerolineae bacterium]|nr:phosphoglucomutase/phosphomannomutase family protein [Anaerolineae bacterium]